MFRAWWWACAFCLTTVFVYAQSMRVRDKELGSLRSRAFELERQSQLALQERDDLALRIASASDPAWVELVLLKQMGVVPEGFIKIHFASPE